MTQPSSTVNFCCVANGQIKNDDGSILMLNKGDDISTVWNNNHYRKIRRQMIEGEQVEGCEPCYDLEKLSIPSYRENYIKLLEGSPPDFSIIQNKIYYDKEDTE